MLKWSFSLFFLVFTLAFGDGGYIINNYRVNLDINEENIYEVKEDIDVRFSEKRRGIYRVIPTRFNGRKLEISDIRVNEKSSYKRERNYVYLRIGDPSIYLVGNKNYKINYNYDLGWDKNSKYDEVYYNLIGNDWDTIIEKLEFSIKLPKDFDSSRVNFTRGNFGSTDNSGIKWWLEGNTIKGYTTRKLYPGESVTIALPLEEGYFKIGNERYFYFLILGILIAIYIGVPTIAFIASRKNKDEEIIETVEFYPPDNMNPTEIGYYIDGRLDEKDLTSLIIYWASKGYLAIEEEDLKLIKIKDIETEKEYERYLFNSLFDYGYGNNEVVVKKLKYKFYENIQKAAEIFHIDLVMEKKTIFTRESRDKSSRIKLTVALIVFGTVFLAEKVEVTNPIYLGILIVSAAISAILTLNFSGKVREKTEYANKVLGKVIGFKRFLIVTEKEKLEMLLKENPSYFYDILPYTIVLGVSDLWADKFKDLVTSPPDWYRGRAGFGDTFMLYMFMNNFNRSFANFNDNLMSAPKAPTNFGGGGSSFGGGTSGGGAGGGGGGSW